MIKKIYDILLDNWKTFFPQLEKPGLFSSFEICGSLGIHGKINFLIFRDNDFLPFVAVKVGRNTDAYPYIKNEFKNLNYIYQLAPELRASIPQPFYLGEIDGLNVLIEKAVHGVSGNKILSRRTLSKSKGISRFLNLSLDWLVNLQKKFHKEDYLERANQSVYFQSHINRFRQIFSLNSQEKSVINNLEAASDELIKKRCPLLFQHGDFSHVNILFSSHKIMVIDWELSEIKGLPLHDIFFLLLNFDFKRSVELEGSRVLNNMGDVFFRGRYSRFSYPIIEKYCQRIGIDKTLVKPLFLLFLIKISNCEYESLINQAKRGYLVIFEPWGKGKSIKDQSLMKDGLYFNLFRHTVKRLDSFII